MGNRSGMNRVAQSLAEAEQKLGLDSVVCDGNTGSEGGWVWDADVNVSHTHCPEKVRKGKPVVWVSHGTPEHVFQTAVEDGSRGYGHGDTFMLAQNWLRVADACVTFWERHHTIWSSMCRRKIDLVPLGVDKTFWMPSISQGKFSGAPSLFTAENAHYIKWPLDLFILWPWVRKELAEAVLHCAYLPNDMHRWFFPLVNANGASYGSHITGQAFDHKTLRNAFCSTDFCIGLVRYGDFNRLSLEANASGSKTISYEGNPYSDFWVSEGDQRRIASQLIEILSGRAEPRQKQQVPDISETAQAMKEIYECL